MRILFSLLDAGLGGGQTVALSVAGRLVADGHSVGVLVPAPGPASDRFRGLGAAVHTADLHSLRRVGSVGRAARSLRAYDVLYSHTSIPGELLGDLAARIAGRRHVVHRHTSPHLSPNRPIRKAQATLYRLLIRRRSVIAVAPHVAAAVIGLGVPPANIHVVPNGVDAYSLPAVPARDPAAHLRIGVLGRADPQKGMDVFAVAVRILRDEDVHADFVVGIANGRSTATGQQVLAELEQAAMKVEIPGPDGARFLAGLDIVVMPSRRSEGSPLTLFEALALGKPVIASDIPGVSGVMAGKDVGLLVPEDDPRALADAIRAALADDRMRALWSANARTLAGSHTSISAAASAARVVTGADGRPT